MTKRKLLFLPYLTQFRVLSQPLLYPLLLPLQGPKKKSIAIEKKKKKGGGITTQRVLGKEEKDEILPEGESDRASGLVQDSHKVIEPGKKKQGTSKKETTKQGTSKLVGSKGREGEESSRGDRKNTNKGRNRT